MEEIKVRLRRLRKARGLTQQALAAKAGVTQGTIGNLESGIRLYGESVVDIARALGVSPEYLRCETDALPSADMTTMERREPSNVERGPDVKGFYPLISFVEAGRWSQIWDNLQPGDAEKWVMSPHNLGEHGFVLRVKGQSMTAPEGSRFTFPEGMLLHVRAGADPVPGQFVIVRREAEAEATFKRYVLVDGHPFLEAINPDWPHRYLRLQEGDVFCGVVVGASFDNLP